MAQWVTTALFLPSWNWLSIAVGYWANRSGNVEGKNVVLWQLIARGPQHGNQASAWSLLSGGGEHGCLFYCWALNTCFVVFLNIQLRPYLKWGDFEVWSLHLSYVLTCKEGVSILAISHWLFCFVNWSVCRGRVVGCYVCTGSGQLQDRGRCQSLPFPSETGSGPRLAAGTS